MKEAVIVAATRTPIGRAFKGSLVECRPDDLTALIVKSLLLVNGTRIQPSPTFVMILIESERIRNKHE